MNASELYRDGRLQEAVDAATAAVKAKPDDAGARNFLAELLCFAGDFERADKQLDALSQVHPELSLTVALSRQLLCAAMWRRQFYQDGRVPEFADKPSATLQSHLQASVHVRGGEGPAAFKQLAEAQAARQPVSGVCNDAAFDDVRDLDDLLSPVLEVLTANGKYYWIAFGQVASIELSRHVARAISSGDPPKSLCETDRTAKSSSRSCTPARRKHRIPRSSLGVQPIGATDKMELFAAWVNACCLSETKCAPSSRLRPSQLQKVHPRRNCCVQSPFGKPASRFFFCGPPDRQRARRAGRACARAAQVLRELKQSIRRDLEDSAQHALAMPGLARNPLSVGGFSGQLWHPRLHRFRSRCRSKPGCPLALDRGLHSPFRAAIERDSSARTGPSRRRRPNVSFPDRGGSVR